MSKLQNTDHPTAIQALYNDVLYIHTGFAAIMSSAFLTRLFYAQRNCGRHIVIALSIPPSVCPSVRPSVLLPVQCISPIFFELGIPNLVCGCILSQQSVSKHVQVTVTLTLTSDLVFRIIVYGAYLLYYLR